MLNVLYLTNNAGRASTTIGTRGWFDNLISEGLRPVLVSPVTGEFFEWAVERDIPAFQLPLPMPDKWKPWTFLRSLWKLRSIVDRYKIQLIHANEENTYPIAQYLARCCGIPVVVTCHFTLKSEFARWAFSGKRQPGRIFFVSQRSMDLCKPALEGVIPMERMRVLHNGLDMRSYQPDEDLRGRFRREHSLPNDTILIGTACAFRPRKQLEHFFEAAERLSNTEIRVVIAGFAIPGEEEYSAKLLKNAADKLGNRYHYVGCLSDMRGFSNALDLFINTSREESFGISVLEALACGCPVVGYDSKAVDEVVLPNGGEIVQQDNIGRLTEAIDRWTKDVDWLKSQRLRARKQAEQFNLQQLSMQLWGEYELLLNRQSVNAKAVAFNAK